VLVLVVVLDQASATKGGPDPCIIVLFRRYDGQIPRILEHEDEQEHDPPISESGIREPLIPPDDLPTFGPFNRIIEFDDLLYLRLKLEIPGKLPGIFIERGRLVRK
jgi:hypothetical protein